MPINIPLKLLFTLIIICFLNGNAFAIYKHKIIVTEFGDPQNWNGPASPGKVFTNRIKKALVQGGRFQVISDENNSGKMHSKISDLPLQNKSLNRGLEQSQRIEGGSHPMKRSLSSTKKYKRPFVKERQSGSNRSEGPHAQFESQMNLEPAVYYVNDNSLNSLVQIQAPLNGMVKGNDRMSDDSMMSNDSLPWPVKLGEIPEKASLYQIRGQVVKFDPDSIDPSMENVNNNSPPKSENAELEVMLQLVQNKTGRVVHKQTFRAFSNSGKRPFSKDMDLSPIEWNSNEFSSMSLALSFLTKEIADFVSESLSHKALEGEIISINNDDVLINIGKQNGVEVGDKFRVYSVGLHLEDPLTENDLGDIYEKMGFIQVIESRLGFSKAVILVGKDFHPGYLVQSFNKVNDTQQRISSGLKPFEYEEKIPWWDFMGVKSIP